MNSSRSIECLTSKDFDAKWKLIVLNYVDGGHDSSLHKHHSFDFVTIPLNWVA